MENLCCMCLSTDRRLTAMNELHLRQIISINLEIEIVNSMCWECKARLANTASFRMQVKEAQMRLKNHLQSPEQELKTLSKLSRLKKDSVDLVITEDAEFFIPVPTTSAKDECDDTGIKNENLNGIFFDNVNDNQYKNSANNGKFFVEIKVEDGNDNLCENYESDDRCDADDNDIKDESVDKKSDKSKSGKDKSVDKNRSFTVKEIKLEELQFYREEEKKSRNYVTKAHKCETCIVGYFSESQHKRHVDMYHNPSNKHKCRICDQRFSELAKLNYHFEAHFCIYQCNMCDYKCLKSNQITYHYNNLHKLATYPCSKCSKEFKTNHARRYHLDHIHRAAVECRICGEEVKSRNYKMHMEGHKEPMECPICKKKLKGMIAYKRHARLHQASSRPREQASDPAYCIECDKTFKSHHIYMNHLKYSSKHRDSDLKTKFVCAHCDKRYYQRMTLERHMISYHLADSQHICPLCSKKFSRADRLRDHVLHRHEGVPRTKDKVCPYCGKGFSTTSMLNKHILIHTGEKPHRCVHCDMRFTQRSTMLTHVRGVHLKIRK